KGGATMKIDRQQLEETYRSRTDEELLRIAADTVALTQEASQLLGYELQRRHLAAPDAGPKKCPGCGLLNPDSAPTCDCGFDFKTHTQRSFEEAYAAVSQRFVAYLADLIIVYLIVLSGYFVSGLLGKPLSSTEAPATAFLYLALFAYMT